LMGSITIYPCDNCIFGCIPFSHIDISKLTVRSMDTACRRQWWLAKRARRLGFPFFLGG
jgi:hypothetical protein